MDVRDLDGARRAECRQSGDERRRRSHLAWIVALAVTPAAYGAGAGAPPTGSTDPEPADLATFAAEVRAAVAKCDPVALAPLVQFPLRVNRPDGAVMSLVNARALQVEFDAVFPPAVRRAIVEPEPDGFIHRSSGIGIAGGTLWADRFGTGEGTRYRLFAVNLPPPGAGAGNAGNSPRLLFVCDARRHRVVIDAAGERLRYRAWNRPRPLTEVPDLELVDGVASSAGTTPCTATDWTFRNGETTYRVAELACTDAGDGDAATGELMVETDGQPPVRWWCY